MGSCLAERLAHYVPLTAAEEEAIGLLEEQERSFKRGATVRQERDPARELYIVKKGWLQSCALLGNGSRQIMRFHFPGDIVGLSSLALGRSSEAIVAVTEASLCPFDYDRLSVLFEKHPRIAALIFTLSIAERSSLADRLVSVGRTSARARVASLICEIFARLRIVEGKNVTEIHVPLTQEEIGDATGLTAVHVNRMMRGLAEDGLIARNGNIIRLLNEEALRGEASFTDRFAKLDTSWLPKPA